MSEKAEALVGGLKKHFRLDSEFIMSALKLCFVIQAILAMPALAQTPSEQNGPLPSQAKQLHGLAVPVPKEIFHSLDQFPDANWSLVKRPEVARWKSQGNQTQIAILLGVVTAEGFIAMEAKDSTEVKSIGNRVLALARGLGIEDRAVRRARSIIDLADKEEWNEARKEWDRVVSDLESGMIELKSTEVSQLISLGGWLRGTEALSALVLQNYSRERSELIRQPGLANYLEKQILAMSSDAQRRPMLVKLVEGIGSIRALVESESGALPEETVQKIHKICEDLVRLSSMGT
ncbi:MAG: hypothetical protein WA269_07850 [Candidatus Udaeobacter sp.]